MTTTDSPEATLQKNLNLRLFQLYVLFGNPTGPLNLEQPAVQQTIAEHVAFLNQLENDGVMFMAGPFRAPDYAFDGSGMVVVRAESLAEAAKIAERDPLVRGVYAPMRYAAGSSTRGAWS